MVELVKRHREWIWRLIVHFVKHDLKESVEVLEVRNLDPSPRPPPLTDRDRQAMEASQAVTDRVWSYYRPRAADSIGVTKCD